MMFTILGFISIKFSFSVSSVAWVTCSASLYGIDEHTMLYMYSEHLVYETVDKANPTQNLVFPYWTRMLFSLPL